MGRRTVGVMLAALMLIAAQLARADYESGKRAWDEGRLDVAVAEWRAAADAGDRRAMLALGRRYAQGLGLLQDYVVAHMWLNLAASRGEAAAPEERDALAAKMTPAQIAAAQEEAAAWRPGGTGTRVNASASVSNREVPPAVVPAGEAGLPPPKAIREAQRLLARLGYAPGPVDGKWGRRAAGAYREFLRDAGRRVSENLTPDGLRAMRAAAKSQEERMEIPRAARTGSPRAIAPQRETERADALHRAARAGDIVGLKRELAAGMNVNARDGQGWTALMHAVNKGYVLMVQPLLDAGADPNVRAPDGATALFMAAVHGQTELINLLMKADADVSVKGPKGKTAVDVARAIYGELETARNNKEDPAVIALLQGMTWEEVEELERLRQREEVEELERLKQQEKAERIERSKRKQVNKYGSIMLSPEFFWGGISWGISWSYDSLESAKKRAKYECQKRSGVWKCYELLSFRNMCGALAIGYRKAHAAAGGEDLKSAHRNALNGCHGFTMNCTVVEARCSIDGPGGGAVGSMK